MEKIHSQLLNVKEDGAASNNFEQTSGAALCSGRARLASKRGRNILFYQRAVIMARAVPLACSQ